MVTIDEGTYTVRLTLEEPGPKTPNPDGGRSLQGWVPLQPDRTWAAVKGARRGSRERVAHETVVGQAVWDVEMPFHPGVTNLTRLRWKDIKGNEQIANVRDVDDVEMAGLKLALIVVGTVP